MPGVGIGDADAVHRQHGEGEQQPAAQLGNPRRVLEPFNHGRSPRRCRRRLRCRSSAASLNSCALTVSALVSAPVREHLDRVLGARTSPRAAQRLGIDHRAGLEAASSWPRLTTLNSRRNGLWKPHFGRRRCSGIWPPS